MFDKNMTQKVLCKWGNIFLMVIFLTVLPKAVLRTQPKLYGGPFLQK